MQRLLSFLRLKKNLLEIFLVHLVISKSVLTYKNKLCTMLILNSKIHLRNLYTVALRMINTNQPTSIVDFYFHFAWNGINFVKKMLSPV